MFAPAESAEVEDEDTAVELDTEAAAKLTTAKGKKRKAARLEEAEAASAPEAGALARASRGFGRPPSSELTASEPFSPWNRLRGSAAPAHAKAHLGEGAPHTWNDWSQASFGGDDAAKAKFLRLLGAGRGNGAAAAAAGPRPPTPAVEKTFQVCSGGRMTRGVGVGGGGGTRWSFQPQRQPLTRPWPTHGTRFASLLPLRPTAVMMAFGSRSPASSLTRRRSRPSTLANAAGLAAGRPELQPRSPAAAASHRSPVRPPR